MAKSATIFVNSPDDDLNTDDIEAEVVDFDQADEDLTDDDEELADGFDGEPVDFEADDEDDGDRGTRGAKRSPTIGANDDAKVRNHICEQSRRRRPAGESLDIFCSHGCRRG